MKPGIFLTVVALAALASCKPTYKATDTPTATTTDSKSSTTDSMSSSGNTMPSTTGSTSSAIVSVPAGTQTIFTTQYPNAKNVVWSSYDTLSVAPIDWELAGWTPVDANDYLVKFDMDEENYYAWYDSDGNWVGSAYTMKDITKLPAAVNTTVTSKYAGYTTTSVNREFHKDRMAYEIVLKKEDSKVKLLVDADGNIIKEKMK